MGGTIGKSLFVVMAALALVAIGSAGVGAATKKLTVWPDQIIMENETRPATEPENPAEPTTIGAGGLRGHGTYYAVISLPVGATIKRLWLNYTKDEVTDPPTYYSICVYLRRKLPTAPFETLIEMSRNDTETGTPGTYSIGNDPADVIPGAVLKVKSGYRYYVSIEPNYGGVLNSLQVEYTTP